MLAISLDEYQESMIENPISKTSFSA